MSLLIRRCIRTHKSDAQIFFSAAFDHDGHALVFFLQDLVGHCLLHASIDGYLARALKKKTSIMSRGQSDIICLRYISYIEPV